LLVCYFVTCVRRSMLILMDLTSSFGNRKHLYCRVLANSHASSRSAAADVALAHLERAADLMYVYRIEGRHPNLIFHMSLTHHIMLQYNHHFLI